MRVAPLAVTNAALTLCTVPTWVYGTANAQDKGTLNPEPLPPLTKPAGPGTLAKQLFGRKATPSPAPVRSIGSLPLCRVHRMKAGVRYANAFIRAKA